MTSAQPHRCPENVKQLGIALLSFLLSITGADAKLLTEGGIALDADRIAALDRLSAAVMEVRSRRNNDHLLQEMDWWHFQDLIDSDGKNLFVKMRAAFAGSCTQSSSDPVLGCLLEMAEASFPFFLLPSTNGAWAHNLVFLLPRFFNQPVAKCFFDAVRGDPDLSRLFPEARNGGDAGGAVGGAGFACTIQLWSFERIILHTAFCWMKLGDECSLAAMASAIDRVLRAMRSLARGEVAKIPALICFNGVGLPQGTRAETLLGEVRDYSGGVAEVMPRVVTPPLGGPNNSHLGFVVLTEIDLKIRISMPRDFEKLLPKQIEDPLKRATDSINLAVPLAIKRAAPVAVAHTMTLVLNPFATGNYGWRMRQQTPWAPVELTVEETKDLQQWCDRVHRAVDNPARIAVQRTIRSLSERDDAVDSFIDAIVAFESLFGERQQVTLSLAACVSKLLESDHSRRRKIYQKVKKLYDQRSHILHGSSPPGQAQVSAYRDEALSYLIACFRVLYRDRPELLAMPGSERDTELLLAP